MTDSHDVVGVGIGPFNLGLAALLQAAPEVDARFFDQQPAFAWHPGLLLEGATVQVPFLADLVTLADPTSPYSFLNYLKARGRLYSFYFRERFHVLRREYDDYCRWVATALPSCRFGTRVEGLRWRADARRFELDLVEVTTGRAEQVLARDVVLGVGTAPRVPAPFADRCGKDVFHSAEFLNLREGLREVGHVVVVGSGQSGAEVVLEMLRDQPDTRLSWLTRSPGFRPMEYSKLGLEQFSPEYVRYFHSLPQATRDALLPTQAQLYKAIDVDTIAAIHDLLYERSVAGSWPPVTLQANVEITGCERHDGSLRLTGWQREQDEPLAFDADAIVLATGYEPRLPDCLNELRPLLRTDGYGRPEIDLGYRVGLDEQVTGRLFVQNAELHTHGIGTPDLGLGAYRSSVIANAIADRTIYEIPDRTVFTTFRVDR